MTAQPRSKASSNDGRQELRTSPWRRPVRRAVLDLAELRSRRREILLLMHQSDRRNPDPSSHQDRLQADMDDIDDRIAYHAEALCGVDARNSFELHAKATYLLELLGDQPDDLTGDLSLSIANDILRLIGRPSRKLG